MRDKWVPIEFPPNFMEMLESWAGCTEPGVGWCFLCNRRIKSKDDFIPGTNTHCCRQGRAFEATHKAADAVKSRAKKPSKQGRGERKTRRPKSE